MGVYGQTYILKYREQVIYPEPESGVEWNGIGKLLYLLSLVLVMQLVALCIDCSAYYSYQTSSLFSNIKLLRLAPVIFSNGH